SRSTAFSFASEAVSARKARMSSGVGTRPDVSAPRARVMRVVLELARAYASLPVGTPQLVLDDFHAVEPVLDVRAADDETRLVPRSNRPRRVAADPDRSSRP